MTEKILDELLKLKESNFDLFMEKYQNLPLHIYEEIERLSYSKTKKECGKKAKIITKAFHNKFITNK